MAWQLAIHESGTASTLRIIDMLSQAGYRVQQSFDLGSALEFALPDCGCPHHGTAACDCHYAILLVYTDRGHPITLVIHGRDGYAWLVFAEHPTYRPNPALQEALLMVLAPILMAPERVDLASNPLEASPLEDVHPDKSAT